MRRQNHWTSDHLTISTAGLAAALVLAGCDSSHKPNPGAQKLPARSIRIDKNAPAEQRVMAIIVNQLGLKKSPNPTDRFVEDLGADSLDCVELVMAMEEEFNLQIADEEAIKMKTPADFLAYLNAKSSKR